MKKFLWASVCLLVGASLTMVGYWVGFRDAGLLEAGHFVVSLDALEKLRAGDQAEGTRKMESICFSSAANLIESPYHREQVRLFLPSLISYRSKYRTNSADWTPTEKRLEDALSKTQGHRGMVGLTEARSGSGVGGDVSIRGDLIPHSTGGRLFVHFGFGFEDARCLLTARVRIGEPFRVSDDVSRSITGTISANREGLFATLTGSDGVQSGMYEGPVAFDLPVEPQSGASSGGAGGLWFVLSTNSQPAEVVAKVTGAFGRANVEPTKTK